MKLKKNNKEYDTVASFIHEERWHLGEDEWDRMKKSIKQLECSHDESEISCDFNAYPTERCSHCDKVLKILYDSKQLNQAKLRIWTKKFEKLKKDIKILKETEKDV